MRISGNTLVVCARGFDRSLLDHIEFENVKIIGEYSNAHRGYSCKTLIFAGFDEKHMPAETIVSSVTPCLARERDTAILFTADGEFFQGEVERVL